MATTSGDIPAYKGKVTHRSWAQLPDELVRAIATYFIWDISVASYCPEQWQSRHFWQNRMVYTVLRDAQDVEKFMRICPQWAAAMETHMFWLHAISLIDPHDSLGGHAWIRNNNSSAPPVRCSPYHHFRNITRFSCYVCRINNPNSVHGLGNAKRVVHSPHLGYSNVCREHDKPKAGFCGLCLREGQSYEIEAQINPIFHSGCIDNEDTELWPNVDATCRACRSEWLWRKACASNVREAVGGRRFHLDDWEAKSTLESFLDLAEGKISDTISVAMDRYWIRTHTKLGDMLSQALAASRFDGREERFAAAVAGEDTEMDLSDAEDDDEDDLELAQLTEDSGIRELALGDWVRNRILDGFWISPADQWYRNKAPDHPWDIPAVHPCPWTVEEDEAVELSQRVDEEHPRAATVREAIPPSHGLCEQSYYAHQKQMRILLLPAMKNIVRRVVIESNADSVDPAIRAARMNLEDVMKELRDEAMWFEGVDWLERRKNARREAAAREEATSDDHSTSSGSSKSSDESSAMTSPVLSTSTLQTTPSPPPLVEDKSIAAESMSNVPRAAVTIAVAPVLDPPRLIHPIPHVPVMAAHLPRFSLEAFQMAWRDACSPLYHCRCKICERAQAEASKAAAAAAGLVSDNHIHLPAPNIQNQPEFETNNFEAQKDNSVVEIKLGEADGEGEEEMDYLDYDDDDEVFDSEVESRYDSRSRSRSPPRLHRTRTPLYSTPPTSTATVGATQKSTAILVSPRKRSCDEIDDGRIQQGRERDESDGDDTISLRHVHTHTANSQPPGTPPKRLRRESPVPILEGRRLAVDDPLKRMLHKRSSEVLVDARGDHQTESQSGKRKRAKVSSEEAESPPTSLTAEDSEHSSGDPEEVDEYHDGRRRSKSKSVPVMER